MTVPTETWRAALSLDADARQSVRAASVGEFAWLGLDGRPDAVPVTPLLLAEQPVLAFPYAHADLARAVAAAPSVVLVLSDPRMTATGWRPLALRGRPRLVEDHDGAIFTEQLLQEELRKYPPARVLIDSPLLRRENWWYVPRLLVLLDVTASHEVAARSADRDGVLCVAADDGLTASTVRITDDDAAAHPGGPEQLRVTGLTGQVLPDGAAALLEHDFSVPDLERWTAWLTRGHLAGGVLRIDERPDRSTLEPPLTLRQRLRRQRELERACRRALNT